MRKMQEDPLGLSNSRGMCPGLHRKIFISSISGDQQVAGGIYGI